MRFPAILQQPRAGHLAGHEDPHPDRPVRLSQSRVAERERRRQGTDPRHAQRRSHATNGYTTG